MQRDLRVLVTGGRFYPGTSVVRSLHRAGARVHASDSYKLAPALHSSALEMMHLVPSASREPVRYAEAIAEIVRQQQIDLIVPVFEEGFYLARYADLLPAPIFAPSFETIATLHDKLRFTQLCGELGLNTPPTISAANREELREAVGQFDSFVARPAFSRGGQVYLTNHGPRAGESSVDDCRPTSENPWLIQPYVEGDDACSFSIARVGKLMLHCVYEPTLAAPGGWSVQFASIEDFGTYQVASAIASETNFNGFVSFDYRRTKAGFVMIECNPRLSAGVQLTPEEWVGEALLGDPTGDVRVVEPGRRLQYDAYLLDRKIVKLSPRKLVHELLTTPDALMKADDILPALCLVISRRHWSKLAHREHIGISQAFLEDITWDGSPMPEVAS